MRTIRPMVLAALTLTLAFAGLGGVAQAQYPVCAKNGQVTRTHLRAGETVVFSGEGYEPGASIAIALDRTVIQTVTADSEGRFSTTVTVPSTARPGQHQLTATGQRAASDAGQSGGNGCPQSTALGARFSRGSVTQAAGLPQQAGGAQVLVVRANITVDSGLSATGSSATIPLTAAGAGLVLAGAGLLVFWRRRRQSARVVA